MSQQQNSEVREIDFSEVSQKVKGGLSKINYKFYDMLLFFKRNATIIAILFVIGAGLGYYTDTHNKVYKHQIIVIPNFGSGDYLYSKIELLNSKIKERDTAFIKAIGIEHPKKLLKIEINPVNNVYDFVNQRETNFELLKLMAEDGNISKVVEDPVTSKNYTYHNVLFSTKDRASRESIVLPLLKYFNDNEYYKTIKKEQFNNVEVKLRANDSIIKQIDGILNGFATNGVNAGSKSSLVYYSENTELSEIVKRKDELINEKAALKITRINYDNVVKETSTTLNVRDKEGANGKAKYILPLLFIAIFFIVALLVTYLRRQAKLRQASI